MLQIQVSKAHTVTALAYWQLDADGTAAPHYLAPALVENPLINALALESVQLFIGGDCPALAPGWYPAGREVVEAVETYTRLLSIGGQLSFCDVCNLLPRTELARLWQAFQVLNTWIAGQPHIYTVAAASACVKTAAARRGLI